MLQCNSKGHDLEGGPWVAPLFTSAQVFGVFATMFGFWFIYSSLSYPSVCLSFGNFTNYLHSLIVKSPRHQTGGQYLSNSGYQVSAHEIST